MKKKGEVNKEEKREVAVLLHDIRSVHNVGSIFRTADALGVHKIYLSGYTPTPLDRFGRPRKDFAKVSLGTEQTISWEYKEKVEDVIKKCKKEKFQVVAIEQSPHSVDYKEVHTTLSSKILFVVGNEVLGVSKKLLSLSDVVAEIPMKGKKESLNVSVAFGVALFRILNI